LDRVAQRQICRVGAAEYLCDDAPMIRAVRRLADRSGVAATVVALLFGVGVFVRAVAYAVSGSEPWIVVILGLVAGPVWAWFWLAMGARYKRKRAEAGAPVQAERSSSTEPGGDDDSAQ